MITLFPLQAEEFYSINFEIEAAMKAEKIDLQGSSSDVGPEQTQYSSTVSRGPEDQFRTGPLDYTL